MSQHILLSSVHGRVCNCHRLHCLMLILSSKKIQISKVFINKYMPITDLIFFRYGIQ